MSASEPQFHVKLAETKDELEAAQRLRYRVFVQELGSDGPLVDHTRGLEADRFDPYFDHLILTCDSRPGEVVGVYRLMRSDRVGAEGFYSEDEYDLTALKTSGRRLLELGRSCLDPEVRGGMAMFHMWNNLARYVSDHNIEILFGVASFHGANVEELAQPLALLHHRHLAPEGLRVTARRGHFQRMDLVPADKLDRRAAMVQVPALIKAYLKLGGYVGEGAYVDHAFNTTDVCLVMDTKRMNETQKSYYTKGVTA